MEDSFDKFSAQNSTYINQLFGLCTGEAGFVMCCCIYGIRAVICFCFFRCDVTHAAQPASVFGAGQKRQHTPSA